MTKPKKIKLAVPQILVLGVIASIFIGAILLELPISNADGKNITFMDSLFTATSAVCVTGLNTITPTEQFTTFGKIVLLFLIEIGAVGFMSFIALLFLIMNRKIGLKERNLIKESLSQNYSKGIIKLIKKIFLYMTSLELIGAIILAIRFIPQYGVKTGIFYSVFTSASAVCNAGFNIIGNNSLMDYQYDWLISIAIMLLTIIGGLGFIVWDDLVDAIKKVCTKKISFNKITKEFSTNTKVVIVTSLILLVTGALFTYVLEKDNKLLMENDTFSQKMLKSFFYSAELRTAGFETMDTQDVTTATKFISLIYMFIGGSSGSTAGGIKTTTFAILIVMVISYLKGNDETVIFKRKVPQQTLKRAIVVVAASTLIVAIGIFGLLVTEDLDKKQMQPYQEIEMENIQFSDIIYETFSAFGTTGLTSGITPYLSTGGKIIIMCLMFSGKVGPITVSYAVLRKHKKEKIGHYPETNDLIVG